MEDFKTALKAITRYSVSWINITISGLNEIVGLIVGVLTSVYLIVQIRKNCKKKRST
jgi:hypothetical protein